MIEDVVFREIGMNKLALVEELADVEYELGIQRRVDQLVFDLGILQTWRCPAVGTGQLLSVSGECIVFFIPSFSIPKEAHNQNILADLERLGTRYLRPAQSPEIAQFFLRP